MRETGAADWPSGDPLDAAVRQMQQSVDHGRPMTWPNFRRLAMRLTGSRSRLELRVWRLVHQRCMEVAGHAPGGPEHGNFAS